MKIHFNKFFPLLLAIFLFSIQQSQAQAICTTDGEIIQSVAEYGNSSYAIGDLTVMSSNINSNDVNDADWFLGSSAAVDVYAALTINSNAVLRLKAGSQLNVYGNITNNGYILVEQGAQLNFYGNTWTNSTASTVGDLGDVYFTAPRPVVSSGLNATACVMTNYSGGDALQKLDGGDVSMNIRLHQNNANNITLVNSNTALDDTLIFDVNNGFVDLGNFNFTFSSKAGWISNVAPDAAYILTDGSNECSGYVEKLGLAPGLTFTFPIGRSPADYTPAIIRNVLSLDNYQVKVANYAEAKTRGVHFFDETEGIDRIWQITSTNGGGINAALQHNSSTNGSTYITNGGDASAYLAQYQTTNYWNTGDLSTNAAGTINGSALHSSGYATTILTTSCLDGSTNFNKWFTKRNTVIIPLPIRLSEFKGSAQNCNALLTWYAALENNLNNYVLQYSSDGKNYENIGTILPKRSSLRNAYSFSYAQPAGIGYYRVTMMFSDGKITSSNTVAVQTSCNALSEVSLFPNPIRREEAFTIIYNNAESGANQIVITATNIVGQQLYSQSFDAIKGSNKYTPNTKNWAKGTYIIQFKNKANGEALGKPIKIIVQ